MAVPSSATPAFGAFSDWIALYGAIHGMDRLEKEECQTA